MNWFRVLVFCLLPVSVYGQVTETDASISAPEYIQILVEDFEFWIPNFPRIVLHGPEAPKRAGWGAGVELVSRSGADGEPIRFYPFLSAQPYHADSIMIARAGGDDRGFIEILDNNGEAHLLMGITNILIYAPDTQSNQSNLGEAALNREATPSAYSGFVLLGPQRRDMEKFRTDGIDLFEQSLEGHCYQFAPGAPDGSFCTLYGRLPNSMRVRIMVSVNFTDRHSWENFEAAHEAWLPRLAALERLLVSFQQNPD